MPSHHFSVPTTAVLSVAWAATVTLATPISFVNLDMKVLSPVWFTGLGDVEYEITNNTGVTWNNFRFQIAEPGIGHPYFDGTNPYPDGPGTEVLWVDDLGVSTLDVFDLNIGSGQIYDLTLRVWGSEFAIIGGGPNHAVALPHIWVSPLLSDVWSRQAAWSPSGTPAADWVVDLRNTQTAYPLLYSIVDGHYTVKELTAQGFTGPILLTVPAGSSLEVLTDATLHAYGLMNSLQGDFTVQGALTVEANGLVEMRGGNVTAGSLAVASANSLDHGDGTLTIDGGSFDPGVGGDYYAIDGPDAASLPKVVLKHGATLELTNTLFVGDNHAGTLSIESGAVVTSFNGRIGWATGTSDGHVTVTGGSSRWTNSADLEVGVRNIGLLEIQDHGRVENTVGSVAPVPGSHGTVNVAAGGVWYNSEPLYVGGKLDPGGVGELNVLAGGSVVTNDLLKVWPTGAVNVEGDVSAHSVDNEGHIAGNGAIQLATGQAFGNNGVVAPGASAGVLTINGGDYLQTVNGRLDLQLGGTSTGQYDTLVVHGGVWLDGGLNVSLLPGFNPRAGDAFPVLLASEGRTGSFDRTQTTWPALSGGLGWQINYGEKNVVLRVTAATVLEADFDEDGDVDGADLLRWRNNFGLISGALHTQGDANRDAVVDGADFLVWQRQIGHGTSSLAAEAVIPEPAAVSLGIAGFFALAWSRRRAA
jgi:T5SS/PEP-CTERM-associated repeat protein